MRGYHDNEFIKESNLTYCLEVCPIRKSHIQSLQFAVNGCFMKIFDTKCKETVYECMTYLDVLPPVILWNKGKVSFCINLCYLRKVLIYRLWPVCIRCRKRTCCIVILWAIWLHLRAGFVVSCSLSFLSATIFLVNKAVCVCAYFISWRCGSWHCCFFQNQGLGLCWSCRSDIYSNYIFFTLC